ncbi:hypothetical protein AK812_SmicGene35938 [Symbiodinium microadriaticum]|uniref:Uncharacterized protein n=1 Tax=Symbiodinium microadriaticum TaxID=2951 RepID=A0A1Q9CK60_SYMMI|nr:hypothetical protein AK812_SmicGene35938 [Symbiodinium microadriaticum]
MAPTNDTIGRPFVKESVGNRGVVEVWAVPREFVGKVVFAVDDSVGNAAFGVADNMKVESATDVVFVKLHLLLNEVCNECVLFSRHREVMGFMPPLDRCKEVSAELLGGREKGAFAGVLEKVVLWNQSEKRNGNVAIGEVSGVCSLQVVASALGRLLWFPMSVDLSPVVDTVLYSWVSCENDSGGWWV